MKETLGKMKGVIEKKVHSAREERNRQNEHVKSWIETRRGVQTTLRQLMDEVDRQQSIRDIENQKVRGLKDIRTQRVEEYKAIKEEYVTLRNSRGDSEQNRRKTRSARSVREEINELEMKFMQGRITEKKFNERAVELRRQLKEASSTPEVSSDFPELQGRLNAAKTAEEEAHAAVDTAASTAQAAHELMQEIRKEVNGLREKHTEAHRKVEGFRRIADNHHRRFVVGMRVMQSIDGIMSTSAEDDTNDGSASVEARDLMDLLMSGETLGLDDLMAFQRNN